jgi:uncharacterized protein (TIGR03435 family)
MNGQRCFVRRYIPCPHGLVRSSVYALIVVFFISGACAQPEQEPPRFEVASVKPSPPTPPGVDVMYDQMNDALPFAEVPTDLSGTRVVLKRKSLGNLVAMAYRVRTVDVSGPSWIFDERFDIEAKLPQGSPGRLASDMMQSLLRERFAAKVHREKKQLPVYALIVANGGPKLRPATGRAVPDITSLQAGHVSPMAMPIPAGDAEGRIRPWLYLDGATMEDLARRLTRFVGERVVDMTKLQGRYEIELVGIARRVDEMDGNARSIFDAVKDLGLRLERRRAEADVITVDSIAKKPTEN